MSLVMCLLGQSLLITSPAELGVVRLQADSMKELRATEAQLRCKRVS